MTAYAERRKHERVSVDVPVDWGLTPDCPERGRIVSFSEGGCFIRTAGEVPPGARVFVSLWLPTGAAGRRSAPPGGECRARGGVQSGRAVGPLGARERGGGLQEVRPVGLTPEGRPAPVAVIG